MSWHALSQVFTLLLGAFMPVLVQKVKQLSFLFWLVTIHRPLDHIPEVFSLVQVRRLSWPWQGFDHVVLHPHLDVLWAWSIVMLENKSLKSANIAIEEKQIFFQKNFVHVYLTNKHLPIPVLLKPRIITDSPPNFIVGVRHCSL